VGSSVIAEGYGSDGLQSFPNDGPVQRSYHPVVSDAEPEFDRTVYLERFAWHPEPELIGFRDEAASREGVRRLGEATWAIAVDYLYEQAAKRAMGASHDYDTARATFFADAPGPSPAPREPSTSADVLDEFERRLAATQLNSQHPRNFGYFTPPPLLMSIAGELLAQVTNQGVDVWHAGPTGAFVEEEVVRWLADLVGYRPGSFGLLTSGGVMANFMAMALARDIHLPKLAGLDRPPRGRHLEDVRVYASDQTHFSIARALDELGFPPETLVVVAADDQFRLRGAPVAEAIARDRAAGLTPLAISAVAGSTNTGAVDNVPELAAVAEREGLWLHVDAAYGGAARLSPKLAGRVAGLERADSVTVDPHKWFFQAYDIGGLLVRDGVHLAQTFGGRRPEYYRDAEAAAHHEEDAGQLSFYKLGFEGTRRWRALKLWLSWKHLGTEGLAKLVESTVDLAEHLARRCAGADDFEALPEVPELSVVCFRHLPGGREAALAMPPAQLDAHQDRLQALLEESGDGWLTTTRLRGATYLRAGIVNYLATEDDIDRLLDTLRKLPAAETRG
jgi:aromatic-L-amino-acid/L-tryptophan decarboxylase